SLGRITVRDLVGLRKNKLDLLLTIPESDSSDLQNLGIGLSLGKRISVLEVTQREVRTIQAKGLSALRDLGEIVAQTIDQSITKVNERTLERVIHCKDDNILVLTEVGEIANIGCERATVA